MNEHFGDKVVDELERRRDLVRATLKERFKHTKPFRMTPISKEEMLYEYDQMTNEMDAGDTTRFDNMRNQYGDLAMNQYLMEMNKLKVKQNG